MCVSLCRDLRRSGSSPGKPEGERLPVGPPKSLADMRMERTHDGQEQHSIVVKPKLLCESQRHGFPRENVCWCVDVEQLKLKGFPVFQRGLWRW